MRRSIVVGGNLLLAALLVAGCASEPEEPPPTLAPLLPDESTTQDTSPTAQAPASFTVLATGDVLIHPALTQQAIEDGGGTRDFSSLFAGVEPAVSRADLAICHMEVPLAGPRGPFQGFPLFYAPPEVATALARVGYDTCSTASNHTFDHGVEGVRTTLGALDAVGIRHTGSARTLREAQTPLITETNGVMVGQVSATFGYNLGTSEPEPWMGNELDVNAILAQARAARAAGAEVVVASLHWGLENQTAPSAAQRQIASQLLADPAIDLIVGHHAHVVQPFEKLHGKWVAYGLGNQVAKHEQPRGTTEEGVMARFRFTKVNGRWEVERAEYLPTLVDLRGPIRLRDLTLGTQFDPGRAKLALDRIEAAVNSLGAADEGLTVPAL